MTVLSDSALASRIDSLLQADNFGLSSWKNPGVNTTLSYKFEVAATADFRWNDVGGGFVGFSAAEVSVFRTAIAKLSDFLNISFVELSKSDAANADLSFFKANDLYLNDPNSTGGGRGRWQYSGDTWNGQAVFNAARDLSLPSEFDFVIHEIGHALGLKHPGDYDVGGNNPPGPFLPAAEDNEKYTVMSYIPESGGAAEPSNYMIYDYAALQKWWGVNPNARAGSDVYTASSTSVRQVIWDAGGVDAIANSSANAVSIDLRQGAFSSVNGTDNLVVAYGAVIENAVGGSGHDTLIGNRSSNVLTGGAGNDTMVGAGGNDIIDGGAGSDTALYSGSSSAFSIVLSKSGSTTVMDRTGAEGTDTLTAMEHLDFATGMDVSLSVLDGVTNTSAEALGDFVQMYIAYFNRAPDAGGLFYWGTRLSQGMSMEAIAKSFFVQPETTTLYPNPDDSNGFVKAVYNNFLGRDPDAGGFNYWVNELNSGSVGRDSFMLAIINGAKAATGSATDVAYIEGKGQLGAYYAVTKGMSDVDNAKAVMGLYDGSASSLDTARQAIDTRYAAALDPDSGQLLISLVGVMDNPFG